LTKHVLANAKHESVCAHEVDPEEKEEKELVVANAHTVINPRTVMVHLDDASIAHATVVCAKRFKCLAAIAKFAIRRALLLLRFCRRPLVVKLLHVVW
jgi:invasion protein IalB